MPSLILKDLLVQKKSFIFIIFYSFFILLVFQPSGLGALAYSMGGIAAAYLFVLGACAYDDKNNSEVLLNSLPVSRRTIVAAKYLTVFVYLVIVVAVLWLSGLLLTGFSLPWRLQMMQPGDILVIFIAMGLLSALYYPIYFRFGYIKTRLFNVLFFLLCFFTPSFIVSYIHDHGQEAMVQHLLQWLQQSPAWLLGLAAVGAVLALMFVSYLISVQVYQRREF